MNLKQLEVFVAVAETGSFSKGAEASFITQSTVSQHISALEQELGLKLLDRTAKGAIPTEAGKLLLKHARQLTANIQEIHRSIDRFKGLEEALLRIGGSNIPGTYIIPALLPQLLIRYPGIQVTLVEGDSREILEQLANDRIELGVIGSSFDDDEFEFSPFGDDRIRLIVSTNHHWRDRSSITVRELAEEPFIMREPGSGTGRTIAQALTHAGVDSQRLRVRAYLGSNEAVKQAVTGGLGISFLSDVSVQKEVERGDLHLLDVKGLTISRKFYLARRAGRELSPAANAFQTLLLEGIK